MKFYLDLICPELLLFPLKPFAVHFFSFTHTTRKEIRTEFLKVTQSFPTAVGSLTIFSPKENS